MQLKVQRWEDVRNIVATVLVSVFKMSTAFRIACFPLCPYLTSRYPFLPCFSSLGQSWNILWTQLVWKQPPIMHLKGIVSVWKKFTFWNTFGHDKRVIYIGLVNLPRVPCMVPSFSIRRISRALCFCRYFEDVMCATPSWTGYPAVQVWHIV